MPDLPPNLHDLSRKDLVGLAKSHGIKANQKSDTIIQELLELDEFEDSFEDDEGQDNGGAPLPPEPSQADEAGESTLNGAVENEDGGSEEKATGANDLRAQDASCVASNSDGKNNDDAEEEPLLSSPLSSPLQADESLQKVEAATVENGSGSTDDKETVGPNELQVDTSCAKTDADEKNNNVASQNPSKSPSAPASKAASRDVRANSADNNKPKSVPAAAPAAAAQPIKAKAAFGHTTAPTKSRLPPPPPPPPPKPFKANTKKQKELPMSPRNRAQMERRREEQKVARKEVKAPPRAAFGHEAQPTKSRVPPNLSKIPVKPFKANTRKLKELPMSPRNKMQMEKRREEQKLVRGEVKYAAPPTKAAFGHGVTKTKSRVPLGSISKKEMNDAESVTSDLSGSSSISSSGRNNGGKKRQQVPAWKVASKDFRRKNRPAAQDVSTSAGPVKNNTAAAFGHGLTETKSRIQPPKPKSEIKPFKANNKKLKQMEMTERNRKQMEKFRQRQEAGRVERAKKAVPAEFTRA